MTRGSTASGTGRSGSSSGPPSGSDDEGAGVVRARRRGDAHPGRTGGEAEHGLAVPQVGPGRGGPVELGPDRRLGRHPARVGLQQRDRAGGRRELGEAGRHVGGVEDVVRQVPLLGGTSTALDDGAAGRAEEQPAGAGQQPQLVPELVRPAQQRHVGRALEVGGPDDAALAVARALIVDGRVAVQREHAVAAAGEDGRGRAADAAEPHDDDVVRAQSCSSACRSAAHASDVGSRCSKWPPGTSTSRAPGPAAST